MYLPRTITIAVTLAIMTGSAFADSTKTVCHSGKSISISQDALKAHQDHGDTIGSCASRPPAPVNSEVAIIRCLKKDDGDLVVAGPGLSENNAADTVKASGEVSCANAVAHMLILGTALIR